MGTHYDTLGVSETASDDEITRAFRKAAMKWHPDRNPGNEQAASGRFKQASDAKAILLDARTRGDYDRALAAGRRPATPSAPPSPPRPAAPPGPPTAPPTSPQSRPATPPSARPGIDRDVWLGIALGLAAQGSNSGAVAAALESRGCASPDAVQIARQAVDMQPATNTFHQVPPSPSPTASAGHSASNFLLPVLGLIVLAAILFAVSQLSAPSAKESTPAAAASAAANYVPPTPIAVKSWSSQLPPSVIRFDEESGRGEIRYATLPASDEYSYFREKQSEAFSIQLLQTITMSGGRQLLLFSSQPSDFGCHACHPLLSAMLINGGGGKPYATILPLQILGTAGTFGNVSLDGERKVSLLTVGPRREGFVFKDGDSGQGSVVEWGNLISIERDRFRPLGSFHVHEDSFNSGFCDEKKKDLCARKDTRIRFSRGDSSSEYFEIRATEVEVDPSKNAGLPQTRNYVLRFNGDRYAKVIGVPDGSANATSAPVAGVAASSASGSATNGW